VKATAVKRVQDPSVLCERSLLRNMREKGEEIEAKVRVKMK
jgi:hypothetical protein